MMRHNSTGPLLTVEPAVMGTPDGNVEHTDYELRLRESRNPHGRPSRIINVMNTGDSSAKSGKRVPNTSGLRPWRPGQSGNPSGRPKGQRDTAIAVLRRLKDADAWVEAYEMAREDRDIRAMVEILRYNTDRRDGKAHTAESPDQARKGPDLYADPRIQRAIADLHRPAGCEHRAQGAGF